MKKKSSKSYFVLFAVLLSLLSLSPQFSEKMRGATAALLGPSWESLTHFKLATSSFFTKIKSVDISDLTEEVKKLQLENRLLKTDLSQLKNFRQEDIDFLFQQHSEAVLAKIIFRTPIAWNSSLWINIGKEYNETLGREAIVKNSPVLLGTSVVGIIDYVGAKQSRVRLITDPGLCPSVRAVRAGEKGIDFLAKGELRGSINPLGYSASPILKGVGFNYDFPDQHGPARDLRTGKPVDQPGDPISLIKVNDHLITTGMDGLFPAGLHVATVSKIYPLKEGDYYYEIEAKPSIGNLHELSYVFVIPPLGYNPDDQPPWS